MKKLLLLVMAVVMVGCMSKKAFSKAMRQGLNNLGNADFSSVGRSSSDRREKNREKHLRDRAVKAEIKRERERHNADSAARARDKARRNIPNFKPGTFKTFP